MAEIPARDDFDDEDVHVYAQDFCDNMTPFAPEAVIALLRHEIGRHRIYKWITPRAACCTGCGGLSRENALDKCAALAAATAAGWEWPTSVNERRKRA